MNPTARNTYIAIIQQKYPQLRIKSTQLNQEGQYNDVIIVNDDLIFRFAKFTEGISILRRETLILNRIYDQLPLAIPNPRYNHLETNTVGEAFIGYDRLQGQPLWLKFFQQIEPSAKVQMAHQLANFLRQLHTIPLTQFAEMNLPIADQVEEWLDLYRRIKQTLLPHMRAEARVKVVEQFENYFAHPDIYCFTPVLRHGDFGTGNLLYDTSTKAIAGVIDFGAATLGDPAIDFAGLFSFGKDFCHHCYTVYPELEAMLQRVYFYRSTFALQEALYGAETGNTEAYHSGMEQYL